MRVWELLRRLLLKHDNEADHPEAQVDLAYRRCCSSLICRLRSRASAVAESLPMIGRTRPPRPARGWSETLRGWVRCRAHG
jgi:hypothetical protein